jgi:hypothetical protein
MKTIGNNGLKWLKITHIVLAALFFGGIMSSIAINAGVKLDSYEMTLETYKRIVVISDYVIRTGAFWDIACRLYLWNLYKLGVLQASLGHRKMGFVYRTNISRYICC